jgi:type VI secretion system protein ImpF
MIVADRLSICANQRQISLFAGSARRAAVCERWKRPMNPRQSNSDESRKRDRYQLSLMHVFRAANADRDAKKEASQIEDGHRTLTERSKERRNGTDEGTLRKHLNRDLASLMNTVNLDATVPLDGYPYLKKSIVNFGFSDLSNVAGTANGPQIIADQIKRTLCHYEPRLIPETVEVIPSAKRDHVTNRLTFDISGEMAASPVDIPLQFIAELDEGVGRIQMTKLQVKT